MWRKPLMSASAWPCNRSGDSFAAMVSVRALHHIRVFYAAYFAAMGLILPFFPVFLDARGFNAGEIGMLVGLLAAAKVVAPPCAGALLDGRDARRLRLAVMLCAGLAAWLALTLAYVQSWAGMAVVVFLFGAAWAVMLPLTDGISVALSDFAEVDYGRLRVWGSLGFIVASFGGGMLLGGDQRLFPWWLASLMLVLALAARGFPPGSPSAAMHAREATAEDWRPFGWLLLTGFLMQASHGAYYGFFSLYLAQAGYAGWQIGGLWGIGVLAEVVLMWRSSAWISRLNAGHVFLACLLLAAVRWFGLAWDAHWWWLLSLQCLHAATFAAFHVAAVTAVGRWMGRRHALAQGWYSAMGFGLGGTLGIMVCGAIVARAGFAEAFVVCAALALLALPAAWAIASAERRCRRAGPRSD